MLLSRVLGIAHLYYFTRLPLNTPHGTTFPTRSVACLTWHAACRTGLCTKAALSCKLLPRSSRLLGHFSVCKEASQQHHAVVLQVVGPVLCLAALRLLAQFARLAVCSQHTQQHQHLVHAAVGCPVLGLFWRLLNLQHCTIALACRHT